MACQGIQNKGSVSEGTEVTIEYTLNDANGNPITSVDKLEYKLSDGVNTLTDWAQLPLVAPTGLFTIEGSENIIQSSELIDRFVTLHYVKGASDTFQPIKYTITDDPNVTAIILP